MNTTAIPFFDGIFQGILIGMIVYAFYCHGIYKQKAFFYYALYLMVSSIFFSYGKKITYFILPEHYATINQYLFISLYISLLFYLLFLKNFFSNKQKHSKLINYIKYYFFMLTFATFLIAVLSAINLKLGHRFSDYFDLVNTFFTILFIPIIFKNTDKSGQWIATGTIFLVAGGLLASVLSVNPDGKQYIELFQAGFVIEIMCFSIALNIEYANNKTKQLIAHK